MAQRSPTVIVTGGVPGAGKSTVARRLASRLGLPCLGADSVGQTVKSSGGLGTGAGVDAYWIAYDVVFRLCEEFMSGGLSVVLDINLGWQFQWDWLDALARRMPDVRRLPIVLTCPRDVCHDRIQRRHALNPATAPLEWFRTDTRVLAVWDFLEHLDRPDAVLIDASRPADEVYAAVQEAASRTMTRTEVQSGWMPPDEWQRLIRGEGCPLCAELAEPDNPNEYGFPVAELGVSRLRLAANQAAPGYCVLICRRHVREPFELSIDEQARYWQDLMRAGKAIDTVFAPTKLNFQLLGNLVPHLHTHIVPRFYGDAAPGAPLDPGYATRLVNPVTAAGLVERLRAALDATHYKKEDLEKTKI